MFNVNLMGTRDQANKICKHLSERTDLRARTVLLDDAETTVIGCEVGVQGTRSGFQTEGPGFDAQRNPHL